MLSILKRLQSPPIYPKDRVKTQRAARVYVISLVFIIIPLIFAVIATVLSGINDLSVTIALGLTTVFLGVFILGQVGLTQIASILIIVSMMATINIMALRGGNIVSAVFSGGTLVILLATFLLGKRSLFIFAGIVVANSLVLLYAENNDWLPEPVAMMPIRVWLRQLTLFFTSSILIYISLARFSDALERSEEELVERERVQNELEAYKQHLEELVAERTMELERNQKALQISEEKLRSTLISMSDIVCVLDRDGIFIEYYQPEERNQLAIFPESFVGKSFREIFTKPAVQSLELAINVAVELDIVQHCDFSVQLDEQIFWFNVGVAVRKSWKGENDGITLVLRDVTISKEIERSLVEAKKAAEQASQAKSEFLANMSHEIRTPLNAVVGMASLLEQTALNTKQKDLVNTIHQSSGILLNIINDILDFSKVETDQLELEYQPFDLRKCLESALDIIAGKAAEKELELICLLATDVPTTIYGDTTRLRQILVHLLDNAVKFTKEGEIVLSVDKKLSLSRGQYEILFSVRDTGIGIPDDKKNRLFHSFSQADASTTRQYGGIGLGLAISKQLVNMMNGKIWVESQIDEGSNFFFTIQTKGEFAELAESSFLNPRQLGLQNKKLWLVEENDLSRQLIKEWAQFWGMEVYESKDMLKMFDKSLSFDIAILNTNIVNDKQKKPDIFQQYPSLPIVLLTNINHQQNYSETEFSLLIKPIKISQLYNVLVNTFKSHHFLEQPNIVSAQNTVSPSSLRVLLAEDNPINQKLALLTLTRLGYQADVVKNGQEVLDRVLQQPYDIILMDVNMPIMDGITATKRIYKELSEDKRPYIIAITANATTSNRQKCINAGMKDYVTKPFRFEDISDVLQKASNAISKQKN